MIAFAVPAPPPAIELQHSPVEWDCTLLDGKKKVFFISGSFGAFRHNRADRQLVVVPQTVVSKGKLAGVVKGTYRNTIDKGGEYMASMAENEHGQQKLHELNLTPYGDIASASLINITIGEGEPEVELLGSGMCSWNQKSSSGDAP